MPSVKKNLTLQTCYQILSVCLPLITAPYLARILGAENLGIFSYTGAVVGYFALFAALGTINYGTRSISSIKRELPLLNTTFWSIYSLQVITSLLVLVCYSLYLYFFCNENFIIASIQGLTLINCLIDITWLFFGLENFTITVTRSIIVKVLSLVLILCCVKDSGDLWIYTLIMLGGNVASQVILWCNLPTYIHFQMPTWLGIRRHIVPNLMLFFPLLAISVYHLMDKTMLGLLSSYEQTGFYYNADKVVNIPLALLSGVGTVLLPRMSVLTQAKDYKAADNLFVQTICAIAAISIAMGFGIAAVAKDFVPVFFGSGYEPCILLVYLFAPIFIIKSFSHISSTQFLIPRHKEQKLTIAICLGAISNLICNIFLIPIYGALGAVIGTLIAELVSCIWQYIFIIPVISLKKVFHQILIYLCFGSIMFIVVKLVDVNIYNSIFSLISEIIFGAILYISLCVIYWRFTNNPLLLQLKQYTYSIKSKIKLLL